MENNKKEHKGIINDISIVKEMETSFIDYAMSVIVSRAIPDARDGLKPVHRRILFAMGELEMIHSKPFKKSARVVGEVLAKYHPHGDSSVYEAMVRMAQSFSLRYPLVWGQGNFGSIDGDSAAAMRYTESRLQKLSSLLLNDIRKDTVDFVPNYDGSELEPKVLPSKIPNLLMNGSTGIAVGMATSIPPHNLVELFNAAKLLARNPDVDIEDLIKEVTAPDFPTAGIIVNANEIADAYRTGRGRVIIRSRVNIEFDEVKNQGTLIITEIPYMVNKSNLIIKIADIAKRKQIESISDISDQSNRKGIRVVIKLKKGFIPEVELNKLFKLTPLQTSFPINMLALINERPVTLNLKTALVAFVDHTIEVLVRRTKFELEKAASRKHILEGLSIALNDIDNVISIIKKSSDNKNAVTQLSSVFGLTESQAKAILEMKLQRLTGLERDKLQDEIQKLSESIDGFESILESKTEQVDYVINEWTEISNQFGDDRRTEINNINISNIVDEDLIPMEEVAITLSKEGYIKRLPISEFKTQNRGGTGSKGASTKEDDHINEIIIANTHTDMLFFTSNGKVFRIRAHQIPQFGKVAKGIPIINLIQIEKDEFITATLKVDSYEDNAFLFVTSKGLIKRTNASEYERVNKNGKVAIRLNEGDSLIDVRRVPTTENHEALIGNSNGKTIRFPISDVRSMGRTAAGVKGITLDGGEVVAFTTSFLGDKVFSLSEEGYGKITPIEDYRMTKRGGKGVATINTSKAGKLVTVKAVSGDEDVIIITTKGTTIRTTLNQVAQTGRNTKGVKVVKLRDGELISSVAIIQSEDSMIREIDETTQEMKAIVQETQETLISDQVVSPEEEQTTYQDIKSLIGEETNEE